MLKDSDNCVCTTTWRAGIYAPPQSDQIAKDISMPKQNEYHSRSNIFRSRCRIVNIALRLNQRQLYHHGWPRLRRRRWTRQAAEAATPSNYTYRLASYYRYRKAMMRSMARLRAAALRRPQKFSRVPKLHAQNVAFARCCSTTSVDSDTVETVASTSTGM